MTIAASLLPALYIFSMRVIDISLYVQRINMVSRGRKKQAWIFAFLQSMVFLLAIREVLTDLTNWPKILSYAAGFATGNVVGMMIENRLAIGHLHLRIITSGKGEEIVKALRDEGYAVTEVPATGLEGCVSYINCNVLRRDFEHVTALVEGIDEKAFITAQNVRPVWRGFWRLGNSKST
jgi:uncharacterized protein YebE (UPF0316 family)